MRIPDFSLVRKTYRSGGSLPSGEMFKGVLKAEVDSGSGKGILNFFDIG